ncbi:hypothetical protein HK405_009798, partial [Cladochytrium tenue]
MHKEAADWELSGTITTPTDCEPPPYEPRLSREQSSVMIAAVVANAGLVPGSVAAGLDPAADTGLSKQGTTNKNMQSMFHRFAPAALALVSFLVVVRTGLEAVVTLGNMTIPTDPAALGLGGFAGAVCGLAVGLGLFWIVVSIPPSAFGVAIPSAFLVYSAGLCVRAVRSLEVNSWLYAVGFDDYWTVVNTND